ncbi:MAG: hypothetical protein ABJA86_01815 [Nocardioidaceae bacterium]
MGTFDRTAAIRAMNQVASRLTDMVCAAADPGVRVPATPEWTVAETYAHVSTVIPRYSQGMFTFHGGEQVGADVALGILLGELVVHGHDIAAAVHRPWPIRPDHVELISQGLTPIPRLAGRQPGGGAHGSLRGSTAGPGRAPFRLRPRQVDHGSARPGPA